MIKKDLWYEFELFQYARDRVTHAVFTRHTDIADKKLIQKSLKSGNPPCAFTEQLHGIENVVIDESSLRRARSFEPRGDVFITKLSQTPLVIRVADCASILLYDPQKKIIANIHAGWRGLSQRIIRAAIGKMRASFGVQPQNLLAGISPMLGPCCSEFSDPKKEFPRFLHGFISEENTVDLWAITEEQLRECGVRKENIENPRICTACHPEDFFSYRREGDAGRFGTAIMLR